VRTLHVVRHALTSKGSERRRASHLSVEGVRQARAMGASLPQMCYVVVGDQARHLETAIAMGYAVDEQVSWPSGYVEGEVAHHDQWKWDQPFARYTELLSNGGRLREVAEEHLGHWRRILTHVPEDGSGLIVSSGGSIEPVLVAAFPHRDHAGWGAALYHLESAVITADRAMFSAIRFLRR
jgi:broad specificity phosphatase PhoE